MGSVGSIGSVGSMGSIGSIGSRIGSWVRLIPRLARKASIRSESWEPAGSSSRIPHASLLMFRRCRGVMLSLVMLPPQPPQPSVIAGGRPVVSPIDPNVDGVFTEMRNAGFFNPNSRMTFSSFEWIDIVCPMPP